MAEDGLEAALSPMSRVIIVSDETGPLTPLDDWYLEFGRLEVLRNQARLALGSWHPPLLWREVPPDGWAPPLPWPPVIRLYARDSAEAGAGDTSGAMQGVLSLVSDIVKSAGKENWGGGRQCIVARPSSGGGVLGQG